jgi:hypothetical protein
MPLRTSIFYVILICSAFAKAQTSRAYSNEFLNIGVDAAALGMSNAVVASTGNSNSGYWNPAGLMKLEQKFGKNYPAKTVINIKAKPKNILTSKKPNAVNFGMNYIINFLPCALLK